MKLHYTIHGEKTKPPLVFLHGFMGSSADWAEVIPCFTATHRCIAVDLPGHGKTVSEEEEDYRMESCAQSLLSLWDDLNIRRCDLIGYSMGGRLAYYLAANRPDRIRAVIIESAAPGLKTPQERQSRIEQDRKLAEKLADVPLREFIDNWYDQPLFATIDRNGSAFRALISRRLENDPRLLGLSLRMMGTGSQPSLWNMLGRIKSPVLLIVGEHDAKFRQIASDVVERCPAAKKLIIDGAGHNVHFENPEEYTRQVSLFLNNTERN